MTTKKRRTQAKATKATNATKAPNASNAKATKATKRTPSTPAGERRRPRRPPSPAPSAASPSDAPLLLSRTEHGFAALQERLGSTSELSDALTRLKADYARVLGRARA